MKPLIFKKKKEKYMNIKMCEFENDIERLGSINCHKVVFATVTELV